MKNYLIEQKAVVFSADNAPTNFGSVQRTGEKNVFKQLKDKFNPNMIGAGCIAHVVHNAIENACDQLAIDVEYIAIKIYLYFYRHTVRLHNLKKFCELVGEAYVKLAGFSKTRFLGLRECLTSIIANFDALKDYFESVAAPVKITEFFNDPFALVSLIFIRDQATNFQNTILAIEGTDVCAIDVFASINRLKQNIESRLQNTFVSNEQHDEFMGISVVYYREKMKFVESMKKFHRAALDYLNERTTWLNDVLVFSWVRLDGELKWNDVSISVQWMIERNYLQANKIENIFDQYALLESYWKTNSGLYVTDRSLATKWVEIFGHFSEKSLPMDDFAKVVEFALVIPGTNAPTERVFSHINDIWSTDKGSLLIENVRARLMVKFNWQKDCLDFYNEIKDQPEFLQKIRNNEKYQTNPKELFKEKEQDESAGSSPMAPMVIGSDEDS